MALRTVTIRAIYKDDTLCYTSGEVSVDFQFPDAEHRSESSVGNQEKDVGKRYWKAVLNGRSPP